MTGSEGSFDAFVADVFDAMSEGGAPYALIGGLALSEAESVLPAHDPRILWLKGLLQTPGS